MKKLTASELLAVWEQGLSSPPTEWALLMLCASFPETSRDFLALCSIGQRDALLMTLREETFGPELLALCNCPRCGERMEMAFDVAQILIDGQLDLQTPFAAERQLKLHGFEVDYRLPNSIDLAAAAGIGDRLAGEKQLFLRCLVGARRQNEDVHPEELPAFVTDAVKEQIALADAQADVQLVLTCPECGHHWQSAFDIVTFLRHELGAWAHRLLHEVHLLASAYGWSQEAILALSPARRRAYLEMVTG